MNTKKNTLLDSGISSEDLQETTEHLRSIEVNSDNVSSPEDAKEEAIRQKVADLKKKHNLKEIFVITSGEKIGYLKRPSRDQMKYATQVAQGNILELSEQVLRSGWLDGDMEIIEDDFYFYGATEQVEKLLETSTAELKKY